MNQPEPQSRSFEAMIHEISKGTVKIPRFQRDFVWPKMKSARLLDSVLKGYPIGTFILWKTKEQLRVVRDIGGVALPPTPKGDYCEQVLDGQQRLTSLYAAIHGCEIDRNGRVEQFRDIFVDLDVDPEADEPIVLTDLPPTDNGDGRCVRFQELMQGEFDLLSSLSESRRDRLLEYKKRVEGYRLSIILIKDAPIDVATEIFTRINVTGQPLSVFEIMVAKTFDQASDFDLAERYRDLMKRLKEVGFGTLPASAILQLASILVCGECRKKDILRLPTDEFRAMWPQMEDAVERACDYFRSFFRIPASRLLPYASLIVPFGYYFARHPNKPTGPAREWLREFFWRTSLSGRYTSAVESKLAQDRRRIDAILQDEEPSYDYGVDVSPEAIESNGVFRTSRSFIKAILCLFAYKQPKSFEDNAQVMISNEWLKQANSRNYHHFFPKAVLRKWGFERWEINHIANITIVDDFLNKNRIKARKPSDYMGEFAGDNNDIKRTMKSHLIEIDTFGIWDDDYEKFFEMRCKRISRELRKWLPERDVDRAAVQGIDDDIDPLETEEEETNDTIA